MILIFSNEEDLTTDLVVSQLLEERHPHIRLNTETITQWRINYKYRHGSISIIADNRTLKIAEVKSVWCRRPLPASISSKSGDNGNRDIVVQECQEVIDGLMGMLSGAEWMNHPNANKEAGNKLSQLDYLQRAFCPFPDTIITNEPATAWEFYKAHETIICKTMRLGALRINGQPHGIYTWKVATGFEREDFDRVKHTPTLFQEWIPKKSDVRTTVVGERVFSVKIYSQEFSDTKVDWRVPDIAKVRHEGVDTPQEVTTFLITMMRHYNLHFAAFDFVEDMNGQWVFLEMNPNGQWAWLEQLTGVPISKEIARFLMARDKHAD